MEMPELIVPLKKTETQLRHEKQRERLREDYKFYQKCLRVLSKKKGKEKLISYIKMEMETIESVYIWPEFHRYV